MKSGFAVRFNNLDRYYFDVDNERNKVFVWNNRVLPFIKEMIDDVGLKIIDLYYDSHTISEDSKLCLVLGGWLVEVKKEWFNECSAPTGE